MKPVFVISPPRARTCWLTVYLMGLGIPAIHEGWKYFPEADTLHSIMEARSGGGVIVNVDSSNAMHMDEIEEKFLGARFINIYRDWVECEKSLSDAVGVELPNSAWIGEKIEEIHIRVAKESFNIKFDKWTLDASRELIKWLDPTIRVDNIWHYFCAGLDIQLFSSRLNEEMKSILESKIVVIGG